MKIVAYKYHPNGEVQQTAIFSVLNKDMADTFLHLFMKEGLADIFDVCDMTTFHDEVNFEQVIESWQRDEVYHYYKSGYNDFYGYLKNRSI